MSRFSGRRGCESTYNQQSYCDAQHAVCYVEGWPGIVNDGYNHVNEIADESVIECPVIKIACNTCRKEPQRDGHCHLAGPPEQEYNQDYSEGHYRNAKQGNCLILEDAPGSARVEPNDEFQQPFNEYILGVGQCGEPPVNGAFAPQVGGQSRNEDWPENQVGFGGRKV
jgi:hypothetical protein